MPDRSKLPSSSYEGELASSILLEDGDGTGVDTPSSVGLKQPLVGFDGATSPFSGSPLFGGGFGGLGPASGSSRQSARGLPPHTRADGEGPNRTPTRTPSPVYQWNHTSNKAGFSDGPDAPFHVPAGKSSSSSSGAAATDTLQVNPLFPSGTMGFPTVFPGMSPAWMPPAQAVQAAYYGMMMNNPQLAAQVASGTSAPGGSSESSTGALQMSLQATAGSASGKDSPPTAGASSTALEKSTKVRQTSEGEERENKAHAERQALPPGPQQPRSVGLIGDSVYRASALAPGPTTPAAGDRRTKSRNKDKEASARSQPHAQHHEPGMISTGRNTPAAPQTSGGKGERKRRGGGGSGAPGPLPVGPGQLTTDSSESRAAGGKSRSGPPTSSPIIEQLKTRDRNIELCDLVAHITEIAQDQYGSRLIQQKLEIATDEEKQIAFKSVLQKMPQLTTDVFGNYVIQKFFEYGTPEQRRILAEQLVGQVLKLSLQMYGCRVVQKALDSVPIEQQVLLIGELKGNVIKCIEDQHGNHVIQKCIERLPTDRIGFIVDSFLGQATRMAKHCYGCRVIQRLIEYCASMQISALLDEVLRCCMELATDQYGNYVVQHVMEHSSRPGDRQMVMGNVRKHILTLSCHKYASNVIEKALSCATIEERAQLVTAIVGDQGDQHPPLLVMMRDRFGNYIVQRVIALAQGPQREMLFWKLREHMPALKKSNTYGKHIIAAMEKSQAGIRD